MAFIAREDGEHFIIPSYRDVLSAKKPSLLRREILLLSSNYGEYANLQRRNVNQYEVAFSPDPGYLLGESVWNYFKRPQDLIYCEAIPNTFEAILVIVKSGIVYLDGSFPLDTIADELLIFRTQQNSFDIYVYGDVPISETPEDDKFAFATSSVKSFTVLDASVFNSIPLSKTFQLQPVETALNKAKIGVFPLQSLLMVIVGIIILWIGWSFFESLREKAPEVVQAPDPYQAYNMVLTSPSPTDKINWLAQEIRVLSTVPGWNIDTINYDGKTLNAIVRSRGATTNLLFNWAAKNQVNIVIGSDGFHVVTSDNIANRKVPDYINKINQVISVLVDSLAIVLPGNHLELGPEINRGHFIERDIKITFDEITPMILETIGQQLKNLPLILVNASIKIDATGYLTGSITLRALGN